MPKTREKIWAKARADEPNDHLDRALKTISEIRKELEDASRKQREEKLQWKDES